MCKCTPEAKTPFCGVGECRIPEEPMNKSNCCQADVREVYGCDSDIRHGGKKCDCRGVTCWNLCSKCNQPCDIFVENIEVTPEVQEKMDEVVEKYRDKSQLEKDRDLLASYKSLIGGNVVSQENSTLNGVNINRLLEAQKRVTEAEVREEMKSKIGAMCGIPDSGDACRAILKYLKQEKNKNWLSSPSPFFVNRPGI